MKSSATLSPTDEEDPQNAGENSAPSKVQQSRRRVITGFSLLGLSFLPYFAMFGVLANSGATANSGWVAAALLVISNVVWFTGIALVGPAAYRSAKARFRKFRGRSDD